jgi:hypothetical protein
MAFFESGVASYVKAQATVHVYFPVDSKGNADVSCDQCYYFRRSSRRCALNGEVCQFPERYVGDSCPLTEEGEQPLE